MYSTINMYKMQQKIANECKLQTVGNKHYTIILSCSAGTLQASLPRNK